MSNRFRDPRFLHTFQLVSAAVGICISLYLLVQHTRLVSGIQESPSFCTISKYIDCDAVNSSRYSEIGGIPLASLGAIYFFIVLVLGLLATPNSPLFRVSQRVIGWLTLIALIEYAALFVVQAAVLKTACLMCLLTAVCAVLIFFALIRLTRTPKQRFHNTLKDLYLKKMDPWPAGTRLSRQATLLSATSLFIFVLCLAFLPSFFRIRSAQYEVIDNAIDQFYEKWNELPRRNIDWAPGDGTMGNPKARIKIVEFSDFQCPHCRRAAFTLHAALKPLQDQVHFTFKHYPLDAACNSKMQYKMHPYACALARLAYCAGQEGKFWEFHDKVFLELSEQDISTGIDAIAPDLAPIFKRDEITACLRSEKSLRHVQSNISQGNQIGVTGTPSVFIDGRLITIPLTIETVRKLVEMSK